MKMIARISPVAEQYTASDALVLPVEAQAARWAPTMRAWVKAAVMPLSLKLPEGFMPFVLQEQTARLHARHTPATRVGPLQQRLPFADGDDLVGRGERQQLAEAPDAAESKRIMPPGATGSRSNADWSGGRSRSQS